MLFKQTFESFCWFATRKNLAEWHSAAEWLPANSQMRDYKRTNVNKCDSKSWIHTKDRELIITSSS